MKGFGIMLKEIRKVTPANKAEILSLSIKENQRNFIEPIAECLDEAEEDPRFIPVGLYVDKVAVGFGMYGKFKDQVWLDRFLIDERYQGNGFGKDFLKKFISFLEEKYPQNDIHLSVVPGNERAIDLYQQFDFQFTGEVVAKTERVMRKRTRVKVIN